MNSDVAFSDAVKRLQTERGSRAAYAGRDFAREITDELGAFLADVDTAFLATASASGQPYVQHRGGAPGFIAAVDEHTLAFVEERGNRQFVTHGNLSENARVCLLLIDYATRRRVKVWGRARVDGERIVIEVAAWDINCPKHIPQKVNAADVADVVTTLRARIEQLEAQLRRRG